VSLIRLSDKQVRRFCRRCVQGDRRMEKPDVIRSHTTADAVRGGKRSASDWFGLECPQYGRGGPDHVMNRRRLGADRNPGLAHHHYPAVSSSSK